LMDINIEGHRKYSQFLMDEISFLKASPFFHTIMMIVMNKNDHTTLSEC